MKTSEILVKTEELVKNIDKVNECELNRILGYMDGLISARELRREPEKAS